MTSRGWLGGAGQETQAGTGGDHRPYPLVVRLLGQAYEHFGVVHDGDREHTGGYPGQRPVEAPDRKGQPLFCHKILTITSNPVCKRPPARQG